jgi:glutathione S-transferase
MILHDLSAGMHPRRVRIFMAEKGLSIERREVDAAGGANAMPDFLRLNPLGKLPVLELDDGSAIAESLAICRYLEALHPQPPLMGTNTSDRSPHRDVDAAHGPRAVAADRTGICAQQRLLPRARRAGARSRRLGPQSGAADHGLAGWRVG